MHLRTIRIRGFKSFADPLELSLEPGVAVVVGSRGEYVGVVDIDTVMNTIKALREEHADEPSEDA